MSHGEFHSVANVVEIRRKSIRVAVGCFDRFRVDLEANDDLLAIIVRCIIVSNDKRDVVVDKIPRPASGGRSVLVAHLETRSIVFPALVDRHKACGSREVVHNPFRDISVLDHFDGLLKSGAVDLLAAEIVCLVVLAHFQFIVGDHDAIATEHLAQVEGDIGSRDEACALSLSSARWADEGQFGESVLYLGVVAVDFVDEERY